jgi:hypothetical protein
METLIMAEKFLMRNAHFHEGYNLYNLPALR